MTLFDPDHWREILGALAANKLRTALTAFGVFWGIFMLMIMLGAGGGFENGVMLEFDGEAPNSFFVWSGRTSKPYRGFPVGRSPRLTNADTGAIRAKVPEVAIVAPRNQLGGFRGGNNITRGTRAGAFEVLGDVPEYRWIQKINLTAGRFVNALDMRDRRKVAVIGTRVRDVLFDEGRDPIGESIRINGVYFKVVGLFETARSGENAGRDTETVFIPFSTFQHAFNYGNFVSWFAMTAREDVPASVAQERVIEVLKKRHHAAPDDVSAFGSWNNEEEFEQVRGLFLGIRVLTWIVGIGTLAAGVIGISNIMLVIVKERTKEIGIRRAVGARPLTIMGQVVSEAVLLTVVAGYVGLLIGMGLMELVATTIESSGGADLFADPRVTVSAALQSLGILVLGGVLAGLIPARRAARIPTVEALRAL